MTDARLRRQKLIAELIRAEPLASQEEVSARLKALGFETTQATVSRDLEQLGAVKVKRGGALRYALTEQLGESDWGATQLQRILRDWVQSVEPAGNLLVIRTPPGSAHLVGAAIDRARLPEVAGTVSGDDTLFVAVRDGTVLPAFLKTLQRLSGDRGEEFI